MAVVRRKITDWQTEIIDPARPIERKPLPLRIRCAIFGVLVTQRAVSCAEGLAREIEAAALFPAGAVARAQLELVGLTSNARRTIPAAAGKLPDVQPLHVETFRYLFGVRSIGAGSLPRHFEIGQLLEAAKDQLGEHVGKDYAQLCDLAHPNGIVMWSMFVATNSLDFGPVGIPDSMAELLLKVCGQGTACIVRNCYRLIEWATVDDVRLPFVDPHHIDEPLYDWVSGFIALTAADEPPRLLVVTLQTSAQTLRQLHGSAARSRHRGCVGAGRASTS